MSSFAAIAYRRKIIAANGVTPAITLALFNVPVTVPREGSVQRTVFIDRRNYMGAVSLSTSTLPPGVLVDFGSSVLTGDSTTVTIGADTGAAAGLQSFQIIATAPGLSTARATVTIDVPAVPTIGVEVQFPTAQKLVPEGGTSTFNVYLTRSDYTDDVELVASNLPYGVSCSFTPSTLSGEVLTSVAQLSAAEGAVAENHTVTITASGDGVNDAVTTFELTVIAPSDFDGPAALPGERLDEFKAWAEPIPDFAAIVAAERAVTVNANTEAALESAIATAAAMTGGDRLVIVPDNYSARVNLIMPTNADPDYDVIIAWQSMVNGTYDITRWKRISFTPRNLKEGTPAVRPAGMPLFETKSVGSSAEDAIIQCQINSGCCRFKFYGIEIRVAAEAAANRSCAALVNFGANPHSITRTPENAPWYLLLSHCIVGGRALDADGFWRGANLGRGTYDNGRGFAMLDCWDTEHGGHGNGSDRGIWNSVYGQGPVYIKNNATDFGGGICFMHGGADLGAEYFNFPNCEDVEISYNWVERAQWYNSNNVAHRYTDPNGVHCPWVQKNQCETKKGFRHHIHHNVFIGQWVSAQVRTIIIKAVNQSGTDNPLLAGDITFSHNIVLTGTHGVSTSMAEGAGDRIGLQRVSINNNLILVGLQTTFPSGSTGYVTVFQPSGGGTPIEPGGDIWIFNNYGEISSEHTGNSFHWLFTGSPQPHRFAHSIHCRRNVFGNPAQDTDNFNDDGGTDGLNGCFDPEKYAEGTDIQVSENVIARVGGVANAKDSMYAAQQIYTTGKAALGIIDGELLGERHLDPGSFLHDGGAGGARLGPDLDALHANRLLVFAGALT